MPNLNVCYLFKVNSVFIVKSSRSMSMHFDGDCIINVVESIDDFFIGMITI